MKRLSKNKQTLIRIAVAAVLLVTGMTMNHLGMMSVRFGLFWWITLAVYVAGYVIVGYDVIIKAAKNIARGRVFDENFLMIVASVGAFCVEEYPEAVAVLTLYQLGEVFQRYAVGKSRGSISSLLELRPDCAYVLRGGEEVKVEPEEVSVGEIIVVHVGDRIPLDGVVESGSTYLDVKALTGESVPVEVKEGDGVLSGSINQSGVIHVRTTTEYEGSTVARILDLAENAADKKAKAENFISRFALVYTPIVVALAVLVGVIPPLFNHDWMRWVKTALNFLVVSCPCAIVISVPMAFFCGIGAASRCGLLVKGSNYVEMLARANVFAMDKTGTITKGEFSVSEVLPAENREEILSLAAIAESASLHPIALAVKKEANVSAYGWDIKEISGKGTVATRGNDVILAGNAKLMNDNGVTFTPVDLFGSVVYVAKNGEYKGVVIVRDTLKEGAAQAIADLKKRGAKTVMLTGDNKRTALHVGEEAGVDEVYAELLPGDKVEKIESLIENKKKGDVVAYLGDGINDAPSLVRADVGIAMGSIGSDSAVEAADAVLMYGDLRMLDKAAAVCRKTLRIVKENIVLSLVVKIGIMVLSVVGLGNMWLSVSGDVGVAILAILNALRLSLGKDKQQKNAKNKA